MENLIRNLYAKYAPDKDVEEQIKYVQQKYGSNVGLFVNEFYKKYASGKLNQDTVNHINENYLQQSTSAENINKNVGGALGVVQSMAGALGEGGATLAGGFADLTVGLALNTKMFWEKNFGDGNVSEDDKARFRKEAYLENKDNILLNPDFWKGTEDYFRSIQKEYEDPTISQAFEKASSLGDYAELGARTVEGIFKSAPSLIAAYSGPGALAVYGTSLAGDKYLEEFDKDPTQANSRLLASAIGTSAIEVGFEFATRRLMIGAGLVGKQGNKAAAEALIKGGVQSMLTRFGKPLAQEGASEAATELTSLIYDAAILNPNGVSGIDWSKEKYRIFDAGIVGSAMGGGIATLGGVNNRNERRRLEQILMPDEIKQQIEKSGDRISKLVIESDGVDADTKSLIEDQINKENRNIVRLKNEVSTKLGNMNETELRTYAKNKNEILKTQNQLKKLDNNSEIYKPIKAKYDLLIKQNSTLYQNATKRRLQEDITSVKKIAKKQGIKKINVLDDNGFQKAFKNTEEGKKLDDKQLALQAAGVSGFYDPSTNSIFINKKAAENFGQVTVASHELLHPVLNKVFGSTESQAAKVAEFKNILSSKQTRLMDQEMIDRGYTKKEEATEYFNVFLDAVADKNSEIAFEKNLYTRIGEFLKSVFREYNINNMDFGDANGVFNFLKAYQEGVKQGEFTQEVSDIIGDLSDLRDLDATGRQDSKKASDQVQQIYEQQGSAGAFDIIELFKPITNKIVEKRRGAPNFDKTLLTEEVETGERGIIDLINEYNPDSGVPLAAYINKFLPARAIEASKRILGEEFTTDITEARGVAAEEVATPEVQTKPKARKINPIDLARDENIKEQYIKEVSDKIKNIDINKATFKNLKDLASEITAKIFNVSSKKITDPTANLTKQEKENALKFIRANALDLIALLPEGAITEAASEKLIGTSTGIPKSLLNKFYTKQDRITKGAGLSPYTKNTDINKKEFLEAFGIVEGKKSTDFGPRTPEAQAVKAMMSLYGKLATNSIVREQLTNQEVDQSIIRNLEAGKSSVQFSKNIKAFMENNDLDGYVNVMKDPDYYINDMVPLIIEVLGDRILGVNFDNRRGELNAELWTGLFGKHPDRKRIISELQKLRIEPDNNPPTGNPNFKTTFFKDGRFDQSKIKDVQKFNEQVGKTFDEMWMRIFDAVSRDTKYVLPIMTYMQASTSSKTHPMRNGAQATHMDLKSSNITLEHAYPQSQAARDLMQAIIDHRNDKSAFIKKFNRIKEEYVLHGIDITEDAKINKAKDLVTDKNHKSFGKVTSLKDHNGKDFDYMTDTHLRRYVKAGVNLDLLTSLKTGKPLTEELSIDGYGNPISKEAAEIRKEAARLNDELFDNLIKGKPVEQQASDLKQIDKALQFSRTPKPEKGISIFDFDQTLANTKEKIKVTMPGESVVYNASPKTFDQLGKRTGLIFLATDIKEAQEYAKSNRGKVREISINDSSLATEDQVLDAMKTLNIDTSEGLLYEMIDSRFKDFYIGDANLNKLKKALKQRGFGGFKYNDGSQLSSKGTESVAIIDKSIIKQPTKIDAAEFARKAEQLEANGAKFDFTEFDKVKGATKGPFFELAQKIKGKFGNKDIFILTARPQNAAPAIQKFLKGVGLDIRLENITGLEDGTPQAKAQFVTEKVAEGYNNFFFGDDAYKNVKAVQDVLDVADVKSDVQQAKIQFSKSLDSEFNKIIEDNKGIPENAEFSEAAAKVRGAQSDKFWSRLFVPPSAEDFKGLLYMLIGKGKKGDGQMAFLEKALIKPFARAYRDMNAAKEKISNQYKLLTSEFKDIKKKLLTATDYNNFTFDQAVRVYLMSENGIDIPGISKRDTEALTKIVKSDQRLKDFAGKLSTVTGLEEGYVTPNDVNWLASTIEMDIKSINNDIRRSEFLNEWIENKKVIFSEKNLNKLEALYGTSYRNALEDILYRMETGSNRQKGSSKLVNQFTDWINNATGNIMFLNVRSSVLQVLSFTNFINWSDNNPIKYAAAVANFPQFTKDFAMIWNSDFLKQRRSGLQTDVSASEIMNQAANSKNKIGAMISYILGKGYLPTQMGDSFAICLGGAGFYRNRLKKYLKQGLSQAEAENKAFQDFAETSEDAQQSARPDKISEQQAGPLGRFILAFQNTPMQYARMIKKAGLDLANGRGDAKTNISKILYYGAMQNFIFSALQNALFALAFDEEEEEKTQQRYSRIANNMSDTILRGTGIYGAAASTLKNIALQFIRQEQKGHRADHAYTVIEGINLSPPIGSKIRKLYSATQSIKFNRDEVAEMGFHIDNPAYDAIANTTSAITNIPLDRAIRITDNARAALDKNNQAWQRIALVLGWNTWDLGIEQSKTKKTRKKKNNKRVLF